MPSPAPKSAKPSKSIFDPFNSSATGHQRADNRLAGSTSWRDSRTAKLRAQFAGGAGGGRRVSDSVGAGSRDFGRDGRTENGGFVPGAQGLRTHGQRSLWESIGGEGRAGKRVKLHAEEEATRVVNPFTPFRREDGGVRGTSWTAHERSPSQLLEPIDPSGAASSPAKEDEEEKVVDTEGPPPPPPPPQIFDRLTIYINGSTAPLIGDHRLKHLLSRHGARLALALGRRSVTHVIVGRAVGRGGCGGGLAGGKMQREVRRVGGEGVQFVTAEWAVESVRAGRRLEESRFRAVEVGGKGVGSVRDVFRLRKGKGEEGKG